MKWKFNKITTDAQASFFLATMSENATRSDTSNDIHFLWCDPGVNSKVVHFLLLTNISALQTCGVSCFPRGSPPCILCTELVTVMLYTTLLEMLVFPVSVKRSEQSLHNLRIQ